MNITPDGKEMTKTEEKVVVPNVVGKSVKDAKKALKKKDLKADMDENVKDENFTVVKQYPSAGSKVKEGTKVYLYNE